MRERNEVLDEAWSEFVMTVAQIADTDITSTFSSIQERAFAKVVGRLLDKREALAAATRVTEEMVERGARWLHSVQHVPAGTRWEHATELVRERYRARAEGLLTAALEGPRD